MAGISGPPIELWDPLLCRAELPYRRTFYPLGFPIELVTNSVPVLAAAEESWRPHRPQYECAPLQLQLAVADSPSGVTPNIPKCRGFRNLISMVSDAHNYVVC